ncbi:LysE family transporter [Vibrio sp. AK197]|uniref:LysE family translocator n=1 Tax=Vibrio olivae TaxID=1243002 RepID=A0ABV5HQV4_9VIBR
MLEILLYALGVMYTPGPVNLIALNNGIQKQGARAIHFYIGVGVAMFIFFFGFSLLGAEFIQRDWLFYFSLIGCTYIVYLAYKIAKSSVDLSKEKPHQQHLSFKDGLLVQLMNPKGLTASLPVATVQFPAEHITGHWIGIWSVGLAILAFGAPFSYYLIGRILGQRIHNPIYFRVFNLTMSCFLVFVAGSLVYEMEGLTGHTF